MPRNVSDLQKLDLIATEAAGRPIRRRVLEASLYEPKDPRPETHLALEGTVTVLASRSGSKLMAEIRDALEKHPADTEAVAKKLYLQYKKRREMPLARAIKTAIAQPVFADILHGDRLLIQNLFVPKDLEVAFVPFPYNGGELGDTGFVVVEHPVSEDVEPLDLLILRHVPALSKAELAAIAKVPVEQQGTNIGDGLITRACSVVLLTVLVVAEVAVVAVTFAVTGGISTQSMERLDADEIKRLGPAASARLLVQRRREFLTTKPKKARVRT